MRQLDLFGIHEAEVKPAKKPEQLVINEEVPVEQTAAAGLADNVVEDNAAEYAHGYVQQVYEELKETVIAEALPAEQEVAIGPIDNIIQAPVEEEVAELMPQLSEAAAEKVVVEALPIEPHVVTAPVTGIVEKLVEGDIIDFTQLKKERPLQPVASAKAIAIKIPGRRGRKSFKEIDAGLALVEVPDDETLFQKMYYPISQVAKWFNVNASLLRFWENEFDILQPRKNRKGDRLFRPEDVKSLQVIYFLLRQRKFSIEGAKRYLKQNRSKAEINIQLIQSLTKMRSFFLELKANLSE